jgi:glycosyltransferase involved in cell wall biosynthesis
MMKKDPLVSVMIPNRNHSMFLDACIESALHQTYKKLDIVVLDNCSDDNSIEVASKYIKKGVRVCKNPRNIGNKNYNVLSSITDGEYLILLCADDLIRPTFIEKSVNIMQKYPNVGYVHCERDYINAEGTVTELDPFFSCSFIAPGNAVLPIYMLTDIGQPAQSLIRRSVFNRVSGYNTEFDHTNADKDLWFRLSLISDYAYIREKLALIRIHEKRETTSGFKSFYHPLAIYLMLNNQKELGEVNRHQNVLDRLPAAYKKLAMECLQIAVLCLQDNDRHLARQYLLFSQIVHEDVIHEDMFKELKQIVNSTGPVEGTIQQYAQNDMYVMRKRSYDPPEGYQPIEVDDETTRTL